MRVYRYGLQPPNCTDAPQVREQMRLANAYYRTLIHRECARRQCERAILELHAPFAQARESALAASGALAEAHAAIKAIRSERRARKEPALDFGACSKAKTAYYEALSQMRAAEGAARRSVGWMLRRMSEVARECGREERAAAHARGLYPGTYMLVEARRDAAREHLPLWDGSEPNDPHAPPWTGEGTIGVHLQASAKRKRQEDGAEGVGVVAIFNGSDTRIHIGDPTALVAPRGHVRKVPSDAYLLRVRIGSMVRAPVWAAFPMRMHRPLPVGARIKDARVTMWRVANRECWRLDLSVDETSCALRGPTGHGAVAVDLGWRQLQGMRCGYWTGDPPYAGEPDLQGEIRVSPVVLAMLHQTEGLRSLRDKLFNDALAALVQYLGGIEVPEWLRRMTSRAALPSSAQAVAYLSGWRSCSRLRGVAEAWLCQPKPADASEVAAVGALAKWCRTDWHLWKWESEQGDSALGRRKEAYRRFARALADRYEYLILENFDLQLLARRPPVDDVLGDAQKPRTNRQTTAPSELRLALINAFGEAHTHMYPAEWTTQQDPTTGDLDKFDTARELEHRYQPSDKVWDQDHAAAATLLRYWRERPGDAQTPGDARRKRKPKKIVGEGKSRWDRARSRKALLKSQVPDTREVADKAAE